MLKHLINLTIALVLILIAASLLTTNRSHAASIHFAGKIMPLHYCNKYKPLPLKKKCLGHAVRHNCQVKLARPVRGMTIKGRKPGKNQRKVVSWLLVEGYKRNLNYTIVLSSLIGGTQESSLSELDYGDGTSLGPFQLISDHGTAAQRKTVEFSGNWYYNGAKKKYRRGIHPAELAYRVERPRVNHYYQWTRESTNTIRLAQRQSKCSYRRG